MMVQTISFILSHVPAIMFVAALIVAAFIKYPADFAARLLAWMLLLPVGVEETWAGLFHVFFPHLAAATIGREGEPLSVRDRRGGHRNRANSDSLFWELAVFQDRDGHFHISILWWSNHRSSTGGYCFEQFLGKQFWFVAPHNGSEGHSSASALSDSPKGGSGCALRSSAVCGSTIRGRAKDNGRTVGMPMLLLNIGMWYCYNPTVGASDH
jgi:hypothetical protein